MDEPFIPIPEELKTVPRPVLERYVFERIKQFSRVFASALLNTAEAPGLAEHALQQAWQVLGAAQQESATFTLRFAHRCRFLACSKKECSLCINNPDKRCCSSDNFDEAYADNQTLKAKCKAEVFVEAVMDCPDSGAELPSGVQVQVFVVDGESCSDDVARAPDSYKELLKSDEGVVLLAANAPAGQVDNVGRIFGSLQAGTYRLPDLCVTDKTDTFRMEGQTFSSFRLVARAVQIDMDGQLQVMQNISPAVSSKFVVKTQRALNDFSKPSYPHHKDRLTRLKYIGGVTADRLRDIQTHMPGVPFSSIETVEQLRQLMLYTDQNRQIEGKLLDVLSMKGRHKHKWDYLREVLSDKIVYDDMMHRVWYANDALSQGVLFPCKQGLVAMDKPVGLVERVSMDGQARLHVLPAKDAERAELMRQWRNMAEESWSVAGHPGWAIASEPMELAEGSMQHGMHGSEAMEGMQSMMGIEDSSNPHTPPWSGAERLARLGITSQGLTGRLSGSPNPHAAFVSSPGSGRATAGELPGAFHFTAQRAIGELKPRLSSGPGSGSYTGSGDMQAGGLRASSGEGSPIQQFPSAGNSQFPTAGNSQFPSPGNAQFPSAFNTGMGSTASPRAQIMAARLQVTHSPAGGSSPIGSPRSASPHIDRSMQMPRAVSFTQQRARQVSSSAECTPNKHTPVLSMFGRARNEPATQGGSPYSHRQETPQHQGFHSSTDQQVTTAKRRRASLPDYNNTIYEGLHMLPSHGSHGMPAHLDSTGPRMASHGPSSLQPDTYNQQGRQYGGQDLGAFVGGVEGQALTPEQQAMLMHLDRFSDGMMGQQQQSLDSPHLLASLEHCLHLSDQGMRSMPRGVRSSAFGDSQRSSVPAQRSLNLAGPSDGQSRGGGPGFGARPSYATSASVPSAASRQSALQRGLNLAAADPSYDGPSFSPSSTSMPSAGSGQSAMQHGQGLAAATTSYGPSGNEAASAFVTTVSTAPSPATGKYDDEQIDRWFDQTAMAMDRSSDSHEAAALVDKQISRMMERSGSFGKLLDSMLTSTSCELLQDFKLN